jgi:hypothetical protein
MLTTGVRPVVGVTLVATKEWIFRKAVVKYGVEIAP